MRQVPKNQRRIEKTSYKNHPRTLAAIILVAVVLGGFSAAQVIKPGQAVSEQAFHFVVASGFCSPSPPCSQATANQIVLLSGAGTFSTTDAKVRASGSFTVFDNTIAVPHPILNQGTWHAIGFVSFTQVGTYGQVTPGILMITTEFDSTSGAQTTTTMKVVCNAPPGGIFTGSPEGVTIVLGGNTFAPTSPTLGVTLIELTAS